MFAGKLFYEFLPLEGSLARYIQVRLHPIYLILIKYVSVCIEKIIFVGNKAAVIYERQFCNRHNSFTKHNTFTFRVIDHKRITTPESCKEYVLPSFDNTMVHSNKFVFFTINLYNFKRIVFVHLVFVSCDDPK